MIIETKFDIGDEVWFLLNNKATVSKTAKLKSTQTNLSDLVWQLELKGTCIVQGEIPVERKESKLFKTKEELIQSL